MPITFAPWSTFPDENPVKATDKFGLIDLTVAPAAQNKTATISTINTYLNNNIDLQNVSQLPFMGIRVVAGAVGNITAADFGFLILVTAPSTTIFLPSIASLGNGFYVTIKQDTNDEPDAVSIVSNVGESVDYFQNIILSKNQGVTIVGNGANWRSISASFGGNDYYTTNSTILDTYTLQLYDNKRLLSFPNNANAKTLTLPATASVNLRRGFRTYVSNNGSVPVTIATTDTVLGDTSIPAGSVALIIKDVYGVPNVWRVAILGTAHLGSMAYQNANAVAITGGSITGTSISSIPGVLANAALTTDASNAIKGTNMVNGQLMIGNTGAAPNFSTLTSGGGVVITNQPGNITITGATINYQAVNTASFPLIANRTYGVKFNGAGGTQFTMPAVVAEGDYFEIIGFGSDGINHWEITMAPGQIAHSGSTSTSAGGVIKAFQRYDCVKIVCLTANTTFVVTNSMGTISYL